MVTAARNNPKRICSEAVFTALCGFCPLPASAGKTNRQLLNRSGNCQTNAELHRMAVVRLRWHKQTQSYAARRIGEGRRTLETEILGCLKRFMAREFFHARPWTATVANSGNMLMEALSGLCIPAN